MRGRRAGQAQAREEERRRLRNDLHDGLGPQLTGVALGLDLLAEAAQTNAPEAAAAAERLRAEVEDAIEEVRRLVQALRPPHLDEVGLCAALREVAERAERSGLLVDADLAEDFAPLPAAVEIAAYRIASEAITNVVRHAAAPSCTLTLRVGHDLHLRVDDAGRSFRPATDGVGTTSMRERAEELGGTCTVGSNGAGGCRVDARLPV